MSSFRSEEMKKYELVIPKEVSYFCLSLLGDIDLVQFCDLNKNVNTFHRKFSNEIRRCSEMEDKLHFLERECSKNKIPIEKVRQNEVAPLSREIEEMETTLKKIVNELNEIDQNSTALNNNILELTECEQVLKKADLFFYQTRETELPQAVDAENEDINLLNLENGVPCLRLGFIMGVILREKLAAFEKMLWRMSHGNVFIRHSDVEESLEGPVTHCQETKSVFIVFFQGNELENRIKKVCEGFHAAIYACPDTWRERQEIYIDLNIRLKELKTIIKQTVKHRYKILSVVGNKLISWYTTVYKIKAIYHHLNLFNMDVTKRCFVGECWLPRKNLEKVQKILKQAADRNGLKVPIIFNEISTNEIPPTYFTTNKFTKIFQILVDSYGIASYGELNPAIYSVITFPFLFAIMFGDAGHGLLLLIFAAWLIRNEKNLRNENIGNGLYKMIVEGRYILLLLGIFSIYTGILYNETFSLGLPIFQTSWSVNSSNCLNQRNDKFIMDPENMFSGIPYPVGIDPIWSISVNKISFLNSLKMKISIIMGVSQMLFGVTLSFCNYIHIKRYRTIFFTCIPRFLFITTTFAYLVFLIFMKWFSFGPKRESHFSPACAPSILITFINMILMKNNEPSKDCDQWMFNNQGIWQRSLMIIILFSIPWMLFAEPAYFYLKYQKRKRTGYTLVPLYLDKEGKETDENNRRRENKLSMDPYRYAETENDTIEMFIHHSIHTIEFVLGTVSHTASYLRLWALSLAHAQLSEVLWEMILSPSLFFSESNFVSTIALFLGFSVFAFLTVSLLIIMEGLSVFLHTLRLHWVEFQSKFYCGQGYAFQPFSFKNILKQSSLRALHCDLHTKTGIVCYNESMT